MKAKKLYIVICLLIGCNTAWAFTPTGVAPAFFGPNALPIPDMSDGQTYDKLRVELAADGYFGYDGSRTADLFARVQVPLFTRWANVSIWMPVCEWYKQYDGSGHGAGDVYLSTDVQVLHNSWFKGENAQWIPQIVIRLGMKTASGEQFERRRHFDDPGYFFDAVMYGLQAQLRHTYASLQATWGGYVGWEEYGDRPMSLKLRAAGHIQGFEPYVQYQWGIKDYPFHQLRIGMVYNIHILKANSER